MRLIDLPSPGVFAGSATLRKDLCRAISFSQTAFARTGGKETPTLAASLKVCLLYALSELEKLHVNDWDQDTVEAHVSDPEANDDVEATTVPESQPDSHVEAPAASGEVLPDVDKPTPLPSILRKRNKQ